MRPLRPAPHALAALIAACAAPLAIPAHAAEHITLRNGFDLTCDHRQSIGDHVRLYMDRTSASFVEVPASDITATETVPDPPAAPHAETNAATATPATLRPATTAPKTLSPAEMQEVLARAGSRHNVDVDLLASVVRAESGGHVRAVSRAGAQGLMQLMPGTAAELGVHDTFAPGENVDGGSAYLDALLTRYHDNLALALAAYNAGPAAVDRWHGIPPYRETRLYVARVIREFNARVTRAQHAAGATVLANQSAASAPGSKASALPASSAGASRHPKPASKQGSEMQVASSGVPAAQARP
jgi:hypothetical protein